MSSVTLLELAGLVEGRLLRRYKRFLADVELEDGSVVTAHCANTGTMASCWEPGDLVLLRPSDDPKRKLRYTWIACRRGDAWVGIDTGLPNKVVCEAARRGLLPGFPDLREVRTEVPYGKERSRIDVWGRDGVGREVFLEVKNATLRLGAHVCFPDAVTARGTKHLRELQAMVEAGHAAAVVFFVNRCDVDVFDAAREIDPTYAEGLDRAVGAGVGVLPLQCQIDVARAESGLSRAGWSIRRVIPWNRRA